MNYDANGQAEDSRRYPQHRKRIARGRCHRPRYDASDRPPYTVGGFARSVDAGGGTVGAEQVQCDGVAKAEKVSGGFSVGRTLNDKLAELRKERRKRIEERAADYAAAYGDGTEEAMLVPPPASRTEQEVKASAPADPDARPSRETDFKRMRRVPRVKTLRRALGFTQEEFATRYQIPLGILRDWEQGRAEPDQPARAYLKVIARDPEHVHRLLHAVPR